VSGATALIAKALQGLLKTFRERGKEEASAALRRLLEAHSGIPSWWVVLKEAEGCLKGCEPGSGLESLRKNIEKSTRRAAEKAAEGIEGLRSMVTLSSSSVVEEALKIASPPEIYVMESRPLGEGAGMAGRLMKAGINVRVVVDSAPGELIREGVIEAALVGADALFEDYLVNKVGTLPLAVLCSHFERPFFVVAQWFKDIKMKYEEFYGPGKFPEPPGGFKDPREVNATLPSLNFYFDLTPWALINTIYKG